MTDTPLRLTVKPIRWSRVSQRTPPPRCYRFLRFSRFFMASPRSLMTSSSLSPPITPTSSTPAHGDGCTSLSGYCSPQSLSACSGVQHGASGSHHHGVAFDRENVHVVAAHSDLVDR